MINIPTKDRGAIMGLQIENGVLYCDVLNKPINKLTLLIVPEEDTMFKYGEYKNVMAYVPAYERSIKFTNEINNEKSTVCTITLENLPIKVQAYVVNRMLMYTLSGFVKSFYDYAMNKPSEMLDWLESQMRDPMYTL